MSRVSRPAPEGLSPKRKRGLGGQRLQLVAALDLAELGDGPGGLMREHRLAGSEHEGIGVDGLDAPVVRAGLHGFRDQGRDALLQCGEQRVLFGDGQRQQPVEELRHRRQVFLQPALVGERKPGGGLEALQGPARDVAAPKRDVEAAKRRLGVRALQIVLGPEHGVALAHGGL